MHYQLKCVPNFSWLFARLLCAMLFAYPLASPAFGLKTHLWIGQQLISEIRGSCRVRVAGTPIGIDGQVCDSIRAHPDVFLSGVLGPDAYPDLITGQVTTHPGITGDWQTNDWLLHLYTHAAPGPDLAFAAGYLVHAAGDVFAHTYVNAYSGDIFVLTDERRVELRHFLLEKYIDSRLPNLPIGGSSIKPVAASLRDKLIHNSDAARTARASGAALHITAMHDVYRNVSKLADDLDRIEGDAAGLLAGLIVDVGEFNLKLATNETQLALAREALRVHEDVLKVKQGLFKEASEAFQKAASALEENLELIDLNGHQAKVAREAAEEADRIGKQAIDEAASLQNRLSDMRRDISRIPTHVLKEVCKKEVVDTVCGIFCPFCGSICKDVTKEVCRTISVVNDAWNQLNGAINDAEKRLTNAQARAAKAAVDVTTNLAIETAKLQEKASAEAHTAALRAAKEVAQNAYELHNAALEAELRATTDAREGVTKLEEEIAKLRKRIVDSESIKEALEDLIARSDILSGLAKNWVHGMKVAGSEYIVASDTVVKGMLAGESNFVSTYLEWWKCSGQAYAAVPVQFGQAVCEVENFMTRMENEANKIVERILPPPFYQVYSEYLNLRQIIKAQVKKEVNDAAIELAKLVAPDPTTAQFIELLAKPESASKGMMNDAFRTSADSNKPLLVFDQVSNLIDRDMGLRGEALDPEAFSTLRNALILAKLGLMDLTGLKRLAWVLGAEAESLKVPAAPNRTSVLVDMVRSIDGNHQWQPFGLPYPSANGAAPRPTDPKERGYGYGPTQIRPGFQLFIDEPLRRSMFLRVFKGPLSRSLQPSLIGYPFPECTQNPFAVAFKPDGTGALKDDACTTGSAQPPGRSRLEGLRRFLNWLRLNPKR